jgi:hypothetical protein
MDDQQPAATDTPLPNVGHVERLPPPEDEVETMAARGFGLIDGAYRPRSRTVVVA